MQGLVDQDDALGTPFRLHPLGSICLGQPIRSYTMILVGEVASSSNSVLSLFIQNFLSLSSMLDAVNPLLHWCVGGP